MSNQSMAKARLELMANKIRDMHKKKISNDELHVIITNIAGISHTTILSYTKMLLSNKVISPGGKREYKVL